MQLAREAVLDAPVKPRVSPVVPRVLHVTGVETSNYYLNSLAEELHPNVVVLRALTLGGPGGFVDALRARKVDAHALGPSVRRLLPWTALRVARVIQRERIQVVHGHLFEPSLVAALAVRFTRCRLVTTRHHSDAIHRLKGAWRRSAYSTAERLVNRTARHIIAPAQMVRRILVEVEGVPSEKVTVIPYPQPVQRFEALRPVGEVRSDLGVGRSRLLVCMARLHPEKGIPFLLEALKALPGDLHLYLLGAGPEAARLEALASQLGVAERVTFLGWRDDALSILAAADLVVHPSLHEALPSTVIEALALGRPIVATDVSGIRDILGDDEFGRIVPAGNADLLAQAVRSTLEDPARAQMRAAAGRRRLLEIMRADRVASAHLRCYQLTLGSPPAR
jgi:glycosyltransferase involved in cell wall biosynthesis